MTRSILAGSVAASLLLLAGCSGTHDTAVATAARDFYRAFADRDGATACALLAQRTRSEVEQSAQAPCEEGLLGEDIPAVEQPDEVQVYGTMAQVRFSGVAGTPGETAFLSRYDDGWRVTAAGCVPQGDATAYDCQVSGG